MADLRFRKRLRELTDQAIEESLLEIGAEFDRRYGSPADRVVSELRAYADSLRTWTVADEELNARPLKQLLADAAQIISLRARTQGNPNG